MNRAEKAAVIDEIAGQIQESEAIFAVDYRGISVPQAAELRVKLREADASFRIVKNTLTERAADQADAPELKPYLEGPTALTFARGDVAQAAKAVADFGKETELLAFKGGLMNGATLAPDEIRALAKLPSREVLYGQLVNIVASPITGVARSLSALLSGVAIALGQVAEKKASGEIPAGDPPAAPAAEEAPVEEAPAAEAEAPAEDTPAAEEAPAEAAAADGDSTDSENTDQTDASA
jgi:large subunit ribosomal protein L10